MSPFARVLAWGAAALAARVSPRTALRQRVGAIAGGLLVFWAQALAAEQVRVMQWNIKGALGDVANNSSAAAQALARIVNYNQPDVLLLNEVQNVSLASNVTALVNWVTNNVPYLGTQLGATFFVAVSTKTDGYLRNGAISRYPILNETTYAAATNGPRGLHAFTVRLATTNLQIFHAHLKCCSDGTSCSRRQDEAQGDAVTIAAWASTNSTPYIFGGDWNEDEDPRDTPECTITTTYHPITTIKQIGGLAEFEPTTLSGDWHTYVSSSFTNRLDYLLAATTRLSPVSGYVFNSMDWAAHGLYTNAQNLVNDSITASDHYCLFADYSFSAPTPSLAVSPAGGLASAGNQGGPFSPSSQVYTLTNGGSGSLNWTAAKTANWLTLSATGGALAAGATTNVIVSINANADSLAANPYADMVSFTNTSNGVGNAARPVNLTVNPLPPVALFTGSPPNGVEPLTVTFSDASTGNITNRLWVFGDGATTNTTAANVTHVYAAGAYGVTLVATGPGGSSTDSKPGYITVLTPFQGWQTFYFGSTTNAAAAADADPDHDTLSNWAEFLSGTDPTDSTSALRLTSVAREGDDLRITWTGGSGKTNILQRADDLGGIGGFVDVSSVFTAGSATNFLDPGAATNGPARYYRLRLGP